MTKEPPTISNLAQSLGTLFRTVAGWPIRVAAARRTMGQFAGMSDYELRDIGLTRQDLREATALRRDADPGRLFQARVQDRRDARAAFAKPFEAPPTAADLPPIACGDRTKSERPIPFRRSARLSSASQP